MQQAHGCHLSKPDMQGQKVDLSVASSGDVIAAPADPSSTSTVTTERRTLHTAEPSFSPTASRDLPGSTWRGLAQQQGSAFIKVLQETQFHPEYVGAKACNLAKLRSKLPEWIMVPKSVALPFGTFEAVLADSANADLAAEIAQIERQLATAPGASSSDGRSGNGISHAGNVAALLARARELVESELKPPVGMQQVRRKASMDKEYQQSQLERANHSKPCSCRLVRILCRCSS